VSYRKAKADCLRDLAILEAVRNLRMYVAKLMAMKLQGTEVEVKAMQYLHLCVQFELALTSFWENSTRT
jgi:hypothetical protein